VVQGREEDERLREAMRRKQPSLHPIQCHLPRFPLLRRQAVERLRGVEEVTGAAVTATDTTGIEAVRAVGLPSTVKARVVATAHPTPVLHSTRQHHAVTRRSDLRPLKPASPVQQPIQDRSTTARHPQRKAFHSAVPSTRVCGGRRRRGQERVEWGGRFVVEGEQGDGGVVAEAEGAEAFAHAV
jgi:hypothetical protein